MHFEYGKDRAGEWRWVLYASNGEAIAVSSEGYIHESDCLHGINLVKACYNATVYKVG